MKIFKKLDLIFFIFLVINILFYIQYYDIYRIILKAEDLWNESLYTNKSSKFKVGNIVILNFSEKISIKKEIDSTKDKRLVIQLVPDKILFDYLPEMKDNRSSQLQFRKNQKDKIDLSFKMALKITQVNPEQDSITLEGNRQFSYNDVIYNLYFRGETNPNFIKNHIVNSEHIHNMIFQVDIQETTNQNLQLQEDKIEINDETKRKIFLEYLKKILQDQSINVP